MYRAIVADNPARRAAHRREVGPATIAAIHRTLRATLNAAMRCQPSLIPVNPCQAVELATMDRPPVVVWDGHQVAGFLGYVDGQDDPLAAAFHLVAAVGLRRGELVGLHWDYVDLDTGVIVLPNTPGATVITAAHLGDPGSGLRRDAQGSLRPTRPLQPSSSQRRPTRSCRPRLPGPPRSDGRQRSNSVVTTTVTTQHPKPTSDRYLR